MQKTKKIINGFIAICIANLPSIFPTEGLFLTIYIIGLIAVFATIFKILNKINH